MPLRPMLTSTQTNDQVAAFSGDLILTVCIGRGWCLPALLPGIASMLAGFTGAPWPSACMQAGLGLGNSAAPYTEPARLCKILQLVRIRLRENFSPPLEADLSIQGRELAGFHFHSLRKNISNSSLTMYCTFNGQEFSSYGRDCRYRPANGQRANMILYCHKG